MGRIAEKKSGFSPLSSLWAIPLPSALPTHWVWTAVRAMQRPPLITVRVGGAAAIAPSSFPARCAPLLLWSGMVAAEAVSDRTTSAVNHASSDYSGGIPS